MDIEYLRKKFTDEYSENIKSEITSYNPDYVRWLEMKIIKNYSRESYIYKLELLVEFQNFAKKHSDGFFTIPDVTINDFLKQYE
jgi:hypothetical protein